jgi:hypothetical protein
VRFVPGKKTDLLSPEEREIVDRFERGAIDAAEAGRLLIESVQYAHTRPGAEQPDGSEEGPAHPDETPEEAAARELVERIAAEIDTERERKP